MVERRNTRRFTVPIGDYCTVRMRRKSNMMIRSQVAVFTDKINRSNRSDLRLTEQAYENIRERILRGQLPFGTTISRKDLSAELGMSTLPVSAALQRLQ